MVHFHRLEGGEPLCELPAGTDLLEVGFVTVGGLGSGCVACSLVMAEISAEMDRAGW